MRKLVIFIMSLFISIQLSFAQEDMAKFEKANQYYQEEAYEQAILLYEELVLEEYISDDLHYNLANAYFRNNELAKAILHYEKALKINPAHEDAKHNLEFANSKTIDKIEQAPKLFFYRWWDDILHSFSSNSWAYFVILFLIFGVAGLSIFFFFSPSFIKKASFYSGTISLALALICWWIAAEQKEALEEHTSAIIMSPTVDINSSPSAGSSRLFVLHEGSKVAIEDRSGEWIEVKLPNGNSGWVKEADLALI